MLTFFARVVLVIATMAFSAGTYAQAALNLTAGWNLLGNSSAAPIDVKATFGDASKITSVWKWNKVAGRWAVYAPLMTASDLSAFANAKGYDVLISVASKEGFWVNASNPTTVTGPASNGVALAESDLQVGWNLVSSADYLPPSGLNQILSSSLNSVGKAIQTVWAWDIPTRQWKFYAPSLETQGGTVLSDYITSKNYLPFSAAPSATDGFWLNIGAVTPAPTTPTLLIFSLIGDALGSDGSFGAAAVTRPADQYPNFWDFCPSNVSMPCGMNGYGATNTTQPWGGASGAGGIYSAELNVNGNRFPAHLYTQSFPATVANGNVARALIHFRADSQHLASYPIGQSVGFSLIEPIHAYIHPGGTGSITYRYSGVVDSLAAPVGWIADTETLVEVNVGSSWTDAQGRLVFATLPVFSKLHRGNYSESIALSKRMEDYPALHGSYATYSIYFTQRLKFSRVN